MPAVQLQPDDPAARVAAANDDDFDHCLTVLRIAYATKNPDAAAKVSRWLQQIDSEIVLHRLIAKSQFSSAMQQLQAKDRVAVLSARRTAIMAVKNANANIVLLPKVDGGTPETAAKPSREDPITALERSGKLLPAHVGAAREIQDIWQWVTSALFAKNMNFAGGAPQSSYRRQGYGPEGLIILHRLVYLPWTKRMERYWPGRLAMVVEIVIDGRSVEQVRQEHHIGWRLCAAQLRQSLSTYLKIRDNEDPDTVDLTEAGMMHRGGVLLGEDMA